VRELSQLDLCRRIVLLSNERIYLAKSRGGQPPPTGEDRRMSNLCRIAISRDLDEMYSRCRAFLGPHWRRAVDHGKPIIVPLNWGKA